MRFRYLASRRPHLCVILDFSGFLLCQTGRIQKAYPRKALVTNRKNPVMRLTRSNNSDFGLRSSDFQNGARLRLVALKFVPTAAGALVPNPLALPKFVPLKPPMTPPCGLIRLKVPFGFGITSVRGGGKAGAGWP